MVQALPQAPQLATSLAVLVSQPLTAFPSQLAKPALQAMAHAQELDTYFVTRRGFRDNLVQYLPTGAEREPHMINAALDPEKGTHIFTLDEVFERAG